MKKKEIFVFGSNTGGIHGAGAARYARENKGAIWGQGEGLMNDCYALPTVKLIKYTNSTIDLKNMDLDEIREGVQKFKKFAEQNPDLIFKVTAIATGLAGHKHEDIAVMFIDSPTNCHFDIRWQDYLGNNYTYFTFN